MAVAYANILFPLYIHPYPLSLWQPLTDAAVKYPDITFTAVVNPSNGPAIDKTGCPDRDFVEGLASLNKHANIRTMGYVHTAKRWDCEDGSAICFCSAPSVEVKANITAYANYATSNCPGWSTQNPDISIDSIFIDEAPGGTDKGECLDYMKEVTAHARSVMTSKTGGEVLFNAGTQTQLAYFDIADVIVILEDTQEAYEKIPDIGVRNGNGKYARKSSAIIHTASNATALIQRDAKTILGLNADAFHSLFYTDRATEQYQFFPYDWAQILEEVNKVAQANKAILGGK
jgi:hypothetical protein